MRKLSKFWKVSFAFMAMTLFLIQGCDQNDQSVVPDEVSLLTSSSSMDWAYTGEVPDACKSVCLVAGQHMNVGSVDVAFAGGDLFVTYNIFEDGIYIEEIHLDVFASLEAFKAAKKVSNGGAIPGKFAYKMSWDAADMVTTHTVKIPGEYLPGDCFYIAAHAALSNGETAWGGICNEMEDGKVTLVNALQFPGNNWSVYFEFCKDECESPIDFTYAWEDLRNSNNDADYNDLVVKSSVTKSADQLKIDLFAVARGASYDHEFKIKVPMQGVLGIVGDQGVDDDGTHYYITVFPSTKTVLPGGYAGNPGDFAANTRAADTDCDPTASATIILSIDGDFVYDETTPYEPFITVWPSGTVGNGNNYDLYIWEVSGTDTWIGTDTKEYPNGILIPSDWHWPIERTRITVPYPDFSSITDGWNPNWANNLVNSGAVWSCSE